jgi:hypothetical protein
LAVDTRNATASGFICSDPLAGIAHGVARLLYVPKRGDPA